ncbi:chordin-like protein 2 isoform X3 [Rhinatrema bivittatum]|uniref:chordin-like protein 2 isoform X3 n=1 Tax=Rhinatrema bivittatum TaxID=194408 RepID=UPI00112D096F|nr:chordin-like protein 2 isoform X3 [Rhinatrema bivittatum]
MGRGSVPGRHSGQANLGIAASSRPPRLEMAPDLRELCLVLGFSALFLAWETEGRARARPDMFCIFHGKRYSPGESWHPHLEPHGLMYCLRCLCSQNASVSCYKIKCPSLHCVSTMTEPHQCCPRCVEPHTPSGLRAPAKSCQYNGTVYQQGEMFAASDLFPARQPDQCVQCSCSDGQIYCGLMTCPEVICSSPVTVPDSCCQACQVSSHEKPVEEEPLPLNRGVRHSQDQCLSDLLSKRSLRATAPTVAGSSLGINPRTLKQKGGGTTIKILLREKHKKACIYSGNTYSHGEVWHPVFRSFGTLPCILCTCKDGNQECHRVTCPSEYPCEYPQKVEGKCCRICQVREPKGEPEKDCNRKRSFRRGGHLHLETGKRSLERLQEDTSDRAQDDRESRKGHERLIMLD